MNFIQYIPFLKKRKKVFPWKQVLGIAFLVVLGAIIAITSPDLLKNLKTSSFTEIERQFCEEGGGKWVGDSIMGECLNSTDN